MDPRTANFVRFYHEKFQKDRPELLHDIKRATKSDQQSKDDVDSLKLEVSKLRDVVSQMAGDMDRKLAEMSYEYNRRITAMAGEYDKLAALVQQVIAQQQVQQSQSNDPQQATPLFSVTEQLQANRVPDLMQSLSHVAALSLQNQLQAAAATSGTSTFGSRIPAASNAPPTTGGSQAAGAKRSVPSSTGVGEPASAKPKTS